MQELVEDDEKKSDDQGSESSKDLDGGPIHPPRRYEDNKDNMDAYWYHPTNFRDYMTKEEARWYAGNSRVVLKANDYSAPGAKSKSSARGIGSSAQGAEQSDGKRKRFEPGVCIYPRGEGTPWGHQASSSSGWS